MTSRNKEVLIETFKNMKLWQLEMQVSWLNSKIIGIVKTGASGLNNDNKYEHYKHERNIARRVLIEKLETWSATPLNQQEITYSDVLEYEERRKVNRLEKTQEETN